MSCWTLISIRYLLEGSYNSNNMGQTPKCAKYRKTFLNLETGQISEITDLESKKYKRDNYLKLFLNVYKKYLLNNSISILGFVIYQEHYGSITKFINTITRKLKRKKINRLGYIWVRDIGYNKFEKHFHLVVATSKLERNTFYSLFHKKKHNKYKLEFIESINGIKNYLKEKELYGDGKERSFGKSRLFPIK